MTLPIKWTDWAGREHASITGRPVSMHAMRGISAHSNGFHTCRLIHILQILLGTIDVPGADTTVHPKPPWHARKEAFVAKIAAEHVDVKLVCCADKVHNASTLVRDLRLNGPTTLDRFTGGREGTLWYYRAVADALGQGWDHWLLGELRAAVGACASLTPGR